MQLATFERFEEEHIITARQFRVEVRIGVEPLVSAYDEVCTAA